MLYILYKNYILDYKDNYFYVSNAYRLRIFYIIKGVLPICINFYDLLSENLLHFMSSSCLKLIYDSCDVEELAIYIWTVNDNKR